MAQQSPRRQLVSVQVDVALIVPRHSLGNQPKNTFSSRNCGVQRTDPHPPDLDVVLRLDVPTTDQAHLLVQSVVDFTTQLRVLVEVTNVGLRSIDFDGVIDLFFLLVLLLVLFGGLPVSDGFVDVPLLVLGFPQLFQHFRSNPPCAELFKHLLHFLDLELELFPFLGEGPNQLVCLALVHHRLILDLFGLVSIPQGRQSFLVVISSRRDGTDHQRFRVSSQSILQNSSQAAVSIGNDHSFSLPHSFVGQG